MSEFELPVTRCAQSGDVNIAYQTIGEGPIDLIAVPGIVSRQRIPRLPALAAPARQIRAHGHVRQAGAGLSDRVPGAVPLEQRMDDLNAIMREIGSSRAALFGYSEGSAVSALFAATYPDRVSHLLPYGGFARRTIPADFVENRIRNWGKGDVIRVLNRAVTPGRHAAERGRRGAPR